MNKDLSNLSDIYKLEIASITTIAADYSLLVTFSNGEVIKYSITHLLKNKLEVLKDYDIFSRAYIDSLGNIAWDINPDIDSNITWENRIDISKETIYLKGEKV